MVADDFSEDVRVPAPPVDAVPSLNSLSLPNAVEAVQLGCGSRQRPHYAAIFP
jgi:hypothetical protein